MNRGVVVTRWTALSTRTGLDGPDDGRVMVSVGTQVSDTRLGPVGRDAGQEPAGGLGIVEQRISRVSTHPLDVRNGTP